jgi:putative FmdB family regulatory protein
MPIYEYQCQSCQHELEALQKISDSPLRECPSCGELELRKKISAAAFRLKGGGWYETDFKTGDKKNIAGDGASGDGGGASSSSSGDSGKKSEAAGSSNAVKPSKPANNSAAG